MSKAEAYRLYRNMRLGIPVFGSEAREASWMINHYGVDVCRKAYEEELDYVDVSDNSLSFDESEIRYLMSLTNAE